MTPKLTLVSDESENATLTWLGPVGSFRPVLPKVVYHALNVRGGQCVHYHFTREGDRIQCINTAVRSGCQFNPVQSRVCEAGMAGCTVRHKEVGLGRVTHGFLCPDHLPRVRPPYVPPSAWDDWSVDGAYVAGHDRKIIAAARQTQP